MSDVIDRANELAEQGLELALLAQRKRAAREQAGLGCQPQVPGMCASCDEAIDPARLHALPRALRCVTCQAAHERETK